MDAKNPKSSAKVTRHATAQRFDAKAAKLSKPVARLSARSPTRDVKPRVHVSAKAHRTKTSGNALADRIKSELQVLVGQPLRDLGRAANMQIVGFGRQRPMRNRRGKIMYVCDVRSHVQSRWRLVDGDSILFGRDDLNYPADETISSELFDWNKGESILDVAQREWLKKMRPRSPVVRQVRVIQTEASVCDLRFSLRIPPK